MVQDKNRYDFYKTYIRNRTYTGCPYLALIFYSSKLYVKLTHLCFTLLLHSDLHQALTLLNILVFSGDVDPSDRFNLLIFMETCSIKRI